MNCHKCYQSLLALCLLFTIITCTSPDDSSSKTTSFSTYEELVDFFFKWREFSAPKMIDGVPDYSVEAMAQQHKALADWQKQLTSVDTSGWPIKHQVDWYLIWAEMNGMDFEHRITKPWERDPAFYVWFYPDPSDVPEREAPNIHGCIELPKYQQPLSANDATEIALRLRNAAKLYEQAKTNLIGNAHDLWLTGTRSIREQSADLEAFAESIKDSHPDLANAALEARDASNELAGWLTTQADAKSGTSGIGKAHYTWNLKNVHLVPYTWEEEVLLMQRELARAHSSLRFFEHRHRNLPKLSKIDNAEDYDRLMNEATNEFLAFLKDSEVLTYKDYMKPAMQEQVGTFRPNDGIRGFFDEVNYRDGMVMRTHQYHWIELARIREEPNESRIRQVPTMYNIFDSRAEGLATAMEELMMNAGLFEDRPRAKELVWIMLAQRAARGLGGLYQHGLEMNIDEACAFASSWVPYGLLPADGGTITHEEQFYLRQPAYGTSYVIGKLDLDKLIAAYARQRGDQFVLKEFMDELNRIGVIPVSLVYWEMTGDKSMLEAAVGK
ncbi:MAG: DUF885 family protein [Saprospiraceae bacterium]|nr:DUF885 family protein [Saprospiraceae bacterium]